MRNILRYTSLVFFHACFLVTCSSAQTPITSGTVTQNFDAMAGGTTLPANWKMSAAGTGTSTVTWLDASNVTTTSFAANSGTPTTGGRYNWGTTAGTDRAIGFIADASYNSPNAVMAFYRNTSGATIQSFTIAFTIERYKIDASTCSVSFYTSSDGITWQAQPLGDVGTSAFAPGAVSYSFGSPTTIARSLTFNSANFANNANLYLKWIFVNTGSTTSQGLGLDDVAITVNTATITANLGDILTDANSNGTANPGETITYRDTIKNTGTANALSVVVADTTAPTGSTKVIASTKTSAVAVDDNYSTSFNTQLTGQNVLTNDFGFPSPTVLTYGTTASGGTTTAAGGTGATDNGGTIVITAGGALTYTPSNNFTGIDKFKYIAGTGVGLPDNDAIVTIVVNAPGVTFTSAHTNPLCNGNSNGSITITASNGSGTYLYSKDNGTNYQTSNVFTGLAAGTYQLVVKDAITGSTQSGSETLTNPAAVTFTFTKTDITCNNANNGSIIFNTTSGGSSPYTYSITGAGGAFQSGTNFTNLAANGYTLVVKDNNGCLSATSSSTVSNPPVITVSGTTPVAIIYQTAMSTVTYTKSGGTGTLTFSQTGTLPTGVTFSAGAGTLTGTPTQTGSFPVSIVATDANGCTGNLAVTINVAPKIVAESFTDVGNTQLAGGVAAPATPSVSVSSLAANDLSDAAITYAIVSAPSQGTVSLNSNGTFLYTPAAGNVTAATFTYTGTSNGVTSAAVTATINFSGKVWYVQAGGGAGDGRSNTPFNTLPSTLGGTGDFIYVEKEVSGTTPGGITLQTSQQLIGAGATLNVPTAGTILTIAGNAANTPTLTGTITLASSVTVNGIDMSTGASTAITNGGTTVTGVNFTARNVTTTSGTGISITGTGNNVTMTLTSLTTGSAVNGVNLTNTAGNVTINGGTITGGAGAPFTINGGTVSFTYSGSASQATASQPLVNVTGNHTAGTILFNTGTLSATNGTGLQFDNSDGTYTFSGTTTLNGGDAGIDILNGSGGTFHFADLAGSISITNPTGTAFNIGSATASSGGGGNVTYNGTISKTSSGRAIEIQNKTAGTVLFSGAVSGTSSSTGINLATNTGATISFTGVITLDGTASVFSATGGGTISATNTTSTIGNSTAPATTSLNVANTNIGLTGLKFQKISSNGGTSDGIILDNTGTTTSFGGLTINGDGSNTSAGGNSTGGTITGKSGSDGSTTSGIGIYLNSTRDVVIRRMTINGTNQNFAIRGAAVNNFIFGIQHQSEEQMARMMPLMKEAFIFR